MAESVRLVMLISFLWLEKREAGVCSIGYAKSEMYPNCVVQSENENCADDIY